MRPTFDIKASEVNLEDTSANMLICHIKQYYIWKCSKIAGENAPISHCFNI